MLVAEEKTKRLAKRRLNSKNCPKKEKKKQKKGKKNAKSPSSTLLLHQSSNKNLKNERKKREKENKKKLSRRGFELFTLPNMRNGMRNGPVFEMGASHLNCTPLLAFQLLWEIRFRATTTTTTTAAICTVKSLPLCVQHFLNKMQ